MTVRHAHADMRSLFDQYETPENRLTHGLVSCLAEDPKLLRHFIRWATGRPPAKLAPLQIVEQRLPGDPELLEEETERRGLPDACIHDGGDWCLIIENKVMSRATAGQLRRHQSTIYKRGFKDIDLLVISPRSVRGDGGRALHYRRWTDVYKWSRQHRLSPWASRLAEYLEVAEVRMASSGYLKEGMLTEFSGVTFGPDHPYNYPEAKRVLLLLMAELRAERRLARELRVDRRAKGRPAVTGTTADHVWDFLRLDRSRAEGFTSAPHLTLSLRQDEVWAMLCLSNAMKPIYRTRMRELGAAGFADLMRTVALRAEKPLRRARGFEPRVEVYQRRYPTQRSAAIVDGRVEVDLRTLLPASQRRSNPDVKVQPLWVDAAYQVLMQRRGNVQLGFGVAFPYARCPAVRTPELVEHVVAAWLALKPAVDLVFGRKSTSR